MAKSWLRNLLVKGSRGRTIRSRRNLNLEGLEVRDVPASMYDVQWLGTLNPTDNFSAAQGINDLGQVVGNSYLQDANGIPTSESAFLYDPATGMVDIGTAGATGAFAWDINNTGRITGMVHEGGSLASGGYWEWAAIWDNGVGYTIPGYGQPGMSSTAYGVNDNGIVVGNADMVGQLPRSEAYTYDGTTLTFLGTLGGMWSYGMDINNSSYVAGFADTGENPSGQPDVYMSRYHAVIWAPDGTITDLGTFGTDSYAYKINATGQAVGSSAAADGFYHAFLWDGTQMIDIGTPDSNTQAWSINNAGQVVGDTVNWLSSTAFLYENGTRYDLGILVNGLGTDTIMSAHDINNLGQIVGYGLHNGHYEAFVLTPNGMSGGGTGGGGGAGSGSSGSNGPTASISGPTDGFNGVTGQSRTVTLGATDPNQTSGFEFTVNWGDGSYDTINGDPGVTASHTYDAVGSFTVTVTVTDADDQTSDPATLTLSIQGAEQQGEVLAIGGTSADDTITIAAGSTDGTVLTSYGTFTTSQVMVYSDKGSDQVIIQGTAGNDVFGINPDAVDVNGVTVQGTSVEKWTADGLAGDDMFTVVGSGLAIDLNGGAGNDRFRMVAGSALNGRVDGGAGNDTLDYGIYQAAVTVNLQNQSATGSAGFAGIEGFVGSNMVDTLIGANSASTWTMTGYDTGTVNSVQYRSFENWIGGSGNDAFKMASTGGVYGMIAGGAGVNTLDYSAYTTGVAVDLLAGTATGARGGVSNIANVFGGSGVDTLIGDAGDNILLGNAGNDVLHGGPGGNDVLVGGAGNDTLTGSSGRNILIGGLGGDTLFGGAGEDMLIGGTTNYDANVANLTALLAEWGRTDLTYQQRVDHLTGKVRGGANGTNYLTSKTVKDDKTADSLTGLGGLDWFWGLSVEVKDRTSGERLN